MTKLVVLPGLDGTATMHSAFSAAVGATFRGVSVLAYPTDQRLDYAALEARVRQSLPTSTPFVLLGESFSGPIALAIAANPPPQLRAVVLSTTFAMSAIPWLSSFASIARFAPVRLAPMPLLVWLLLGPWRTRQWEATLHNALQAVEPAVLRHRASLTLSVNVTALLPSIALPVLYLRATADRLLAPDAHRPITSGIPKAYMVDIEGPHLLLQTAAGACADAITRFVAELQ